MNLEESDSFKEQFEKNDRNKKNVMISIIFCAFLIVFLIVMIFVIKRKDALTLKMFFDGTQISIPENFIKTIDDTIYVNIKDLASMYGYTYTKGVYGEYNENDDSCYLQNDFEVVAITAGENTYTKYIEMTAPTELGGIEVISKNSNGYNEKFKLEKEVIYKDDLLFMPLDYVPEMFNTQIDWQEYRIRFYSLNYIVESGKAKAVKFKALEISGYYENLRAMLYGYAIVGNGNANESTTGSLYGVIALNNGQEIISTKYDDIVFIQNSKEFYITAANGNVGILNSEGGTVIAPSEYEEISLLDDETKLYLVKKEEQYGVLDKTGKVIIYAENDKIGIDSSSYKLEKINNEQIIFDKCIPVEKNKKYGLYNIYGDVVLEGVYDNFGCKVSNGTTTNEQNVLIIPSSCGINGIVVNYDDLYGIYDVNTEALILPCVASKIYAITKSGKTTYYFEYNGEQIVLADWLKENKLNNIDEDENTSLGTINENNEIEEN